MVAKTQGVTSCLQPAHALTPPTNLRSQAEVITAIHDGVPAEAVTATHPAVGGGTSAPELQGLLFSLQRCSQELRAAGKAAKPCCSVIPHNQ